MPPIKKKIKDLPPLDALEITIRFKKKGVSVSEFARRLSEKFGKTVWPSAVWSVISRKPGHVFPEIKQELADFLECDISQVGVEPRRPQVVEEETAAA